MLQVCARDIELRGQLAGLSSLPLPCGCWVMNSGVQPWQSPSLPTEPRWPLGAIA